MPRTIQIRDVPEDLYRRLETRAGLEGLSVSGLVLREIERWAGRPVGSGVRRRLAARARVEPRVSPARAVRDERGPLG